MNNILSTINFTVVPCKVEDILHYKGQANKEGVVMDNKTNYIAGAVDGNIIAFVGYMSVGSALRFKSDWVHPDWRGLGIYQALFASRLTEVAASGKEVTAFCTQLSLPTYLKNGFTIEKVLARGSTFVKIKI